jgi:hypothetical protein
VSYATWGNLYRKFVHPGGFYLGAEVLIQTTQTNLLTAPLVKLDSDAGEITFETTVSLLGTLTTSSDTTLIQTMGATSYVSGDSDQDFIWHNMNGLLETDSSYTDRNADSSQTIFTVRLEPNMQIRDIASLTIDSANETYSSIYDLAKASYEYYPSS